MNEPMEPELSIEQACRQGLIRGDDFANTCNADGSVKYHPKTTTYTIRGTNISFTANDTILYVGFASVLLIVVVLAVVLFKRRKNKK